jgi:hypothetical protein
MGNFHHPLGNPGKKGLSLQSQRGDMSAVYMIEGKPHRACDCDESSQICPFGIKRELQTCGFVRCFVPAPDAWTAVPDITVAVIITVR